MTPPSHRAEATYLRAALLLGLVSCEQVLAWATLTIEEESAPSAEMIDLSLTAPELTALREALRPLAAATESEQVARRLLDATAEDFIEGRRALKDTLTVLMQLSRNVPTPKAWDDRIKELQDEFMLGEVGVPGHTTDLAPQLTQWFRSILSDRPPRSPA